MEKQNFRSICIIIDFIDIDIDIDEGIAALIMYLKRRNICDAFINEEARCFQIRSSV